ncbi:MAG: hypothetical protein JWN72_449 [Thermoleophilia bacterium]|nr:hypothetical protein [Thermoleophilia bacterium]
MSKPASRVHLLFMLVVNDRRRDMSTTLPAPERLRRPSISAPPESGPDTRTSTRVALSWTIGAIALALTLRLPYLQLPLRVDEGGLALVGRSFLAAHGHAVGSLYGDLWIDRPPLLVLIYGMADWLGGAVGVRLVGAVAAAGMVATTCAIATRIGARRAVPYVGVVTALLTSAPRLSGPFAYPELLAATVTAVVVLLCCTALQESTTPRSRWFAIGLLAVSALLLKQSFLDGLAVGAVSALLVARRVGWTRTLLPYAGGVAAALLATLAWAATIGPGVRAFTWAMFGFRIAGVHALTTSPIPMSARFHRLLVASYDAGLPVLLPAAAIAIAILWRRRRRGLAVLFTAWLGAGLVGVLGGGYYWSHYMLQLVPAVAVLGGVATAQLPKRWLRVSVAVVFVVFVVATSLPTVVRERSHLHQASVTATAGVVAANRRPDDRVLVLYSRANAAYYTHAQPAFAYQWSLMYLAVPGVEARLDALLASRSRPDWIIRWQRPEHFGLDRSGDTAVLVDTGYRRVATVCGRDVLLRREDPRTIHGVPQLTAEACRA